MNKSDYSVEGLDSLHDFVDSFFDQPHPDNIKNHNQLVKEIGDHDAMVDTQFDALSELEALDNDLYEHWF